MSLLRVRAFQQLGQKTCSSLWITDLPRAFAVPIAHRYFSSLKPAIRDPEAPSRPPSSWLRYLSDVRKQQPAGTEPKSVFKTASTQWKLLGDPEKKKFVEPYLSEMKAYEEKRKSYIDSGKKDAWSRDPARPKSPSTPYLKFASEFRRTNAVGVKVTEAAKMTANAWKVLTPDQKKPYEQDYAAEKEVYSKNLQAYKKSGKEDLWKEKVGISAVENKKQALKAKEIEKKSVMKAKEKKKADQVKRQEMEKVIKLKAKERLLKEKGSKDNAKALKLKEDTTKLQAAKLREKEKEKTLKLKEKDKAMKLQTREKALKAKDKEKEKARKLKEKERASKLKERAKANASTRK